MQSLHETDAEAHEMDGNQPVEIPVKKAKLGHILKVPAPLGAQKSHEKEVPEFLLALFTWLR